MSARYITQEIGDELLILDTVENNCHALSTEASFIHNLLVEGVGIAEITQKFSDRFPENRELAEEIIQSVQIFLTETKPAEVNDSGAAVIAGDFSGKVSRREVLKVAGVALVTTAVLPRPVAARSSFTVGCSCPSFYAALGGGNNAANDVCYVCVATEFDCPAGGAACSDCTGVGFCPPGMPFLCLGGQVANGSGLCGTTFPGFPTSNC